MGETQEPTSFMGLPFDIRFLVYKLVLITERIDIELEEGPSKTQEIRRAYSFDRSTRCIVETIETTDRIVSRLQISGLKGGMPSLFLCSKVIYQEASSIFYSMNKFHFYISNGERDWWTLYNWLLTIGPLDRAYLANIKIHFFDSECLLHGDSSRRERIGLEDFPGTSYLTLPQIAMCEWVEVVSPTIQSIFQELSCRSNKLTLTFELSPDDYDPADVYRLSTDTDSGSYSSENHDHDDHGHVESNLITSVPNSVDKYRGLYGRGMIDVFWRAPERLSMLPKRKHQFRQCGWEIVKEEVDSLSGPPPYGPGLQLTLRKKPIIVSND